MNLDGKTLLITGATGSFGKACIARLLTDHDPQAIRIFSRDEVKQSELRAQYADEDRLRFLLGDVRDLDRLRLATRGVDLIIHAAALKQVPVCESNPLEVIKTNVTGASNLVQAAVENNVGIVIGLSSDKACGALNLYGSTKAAAEKLFAEAGTYGATLFASVRYGNVVGSRGSVIPLFRAQAATGVVTITDERMTRFWITLDQAVDFVLSSLEMIRGGETFIPKIPSARIADLADAIAPGCGHAITGIRPGEKLHETLLTEDEARNATDLGDRYAINSAAGESLPEGFRYASDTNDDWLTVEYLRHMEDSWTSATSAS